MILTKTDNRNIVIIAVYSLIFLLIRLLPSLHGMTYDEAEQFIDAQNYELGYLDQPPLYSWIIKSFSLVFGMNVPMMVVVYHLVVFGFLIALYFALKEIWQDKYAWLVQCSFLVFFIFSYDFYRYTIHTALASMFCALSLWIYIRLLKYSKTSDYLLLGLFFGLGLLSKYNFLFFITVLIFASLATPLARKVLFNSRTNFSILICLLVFFPHFYWLYQNDFPSIAYAMERGDAGDSSINYLGVLLNTYWNVLVYCGVFLVFFFKDFNLNHLKKEDFFRTFRYAGFFAILLPLFLIIVLQAGNFSQRWMAPLNFFIPLALFSFVEFKIQSKRYKLFYIASIILVLVFVGVRLASYYMPDKFGPSFISKPYKEIYKNLANDLKTKGLDIKNVEFVSFKEVGILAGIKTFYPKQEVEVLRNNSKLELDENKTQIIIWDHDRDDNFKKIMESRENDYEYLFSKSAKYLYSSELEPYQVNFAKYLVE